MRPLRPALLASAFVLACVGTPFVESKLRFDSTLDADLFQRARACFLQREPAWEHVPLQRNRFSIDEMWCRGEGAAESRCDEEFQKRENVDWFNLAVIGLDRNRDGHLVIFALRHRPAPDWDVEVMIAEGVLAIDFIRGDEWISAGNVAPRYSIERMTFFAGADDEPEVVLRRLQSSPESLRDEIVTQLHVLEAQVIEGLNADVVFECVDRTGKPVQQWSPCLRRPIGAERKAAEERAVKAHVVQMAELLEEEHVAMHAALLELMPIDCL